MDRNQHLNQINDHINQVLNTRLRPLLEEAAEVIEKQDLGKRIPATELAKQIAERHGMTGPQLYPTLKFLFEGYPSVKVSRGAKGGIERLDYNASVVSNETDDKENDNE